MLQNFAKSLLLLLVSYGALGEDNQGYLVADYSNFTPYCERPEPNDVCNTTNRLAEFVDGRMKRNREAIYRKLESTYESFKVRQIAVSVACKESIAEYICSEIYICDNTNSSFAKNTDRKQRACLAGKRYCSWEVKKYTKIRFENCDNITRNAIAIPKRCTGLPDTNVCPRRTYKVLRGKNVFLYPIIIPLAERNLHNLKSNFSSSCLQTLTNVYCYILGGPVCSDDERLLIHVISRQECHEALKKCFTVKKTAWIENVVDKCNSLPNITSRKVILPSGINARSILEPTVPGNDGELPTTRFNNGTGNRTIDRNGDGNGQNDGKGNGKGRGNKNGRNIANIAILAIAMLYTVYIILG